MGLNVVMSQRQTLPQQSKMVPIANNKTIQSESLMRLVSRRVFDECKACSMNCVTRHAEFGHFTTLTEKLNKFFRRNLTKENGSELRVKTEQRKTKDLTLVSTLPTYSVREARS